MIRVAVVGTGGIAGICHLPALRAQAHRARVVAAADVDEARVGAFCAEPAIPGAYPSLEAMLDERVRFVSLDVRAGSRGPQSAELELEIDGTVSHAQATGDGPVDATFNAIRALFPHEATLVLFSVGAVTEGTDAQAKTTVRLEEGGKLVDGQGADTDTIVASARAYIHALNKLLVKRTRTEPVALSA